MLIKMGLHLPLYTVVNVLRLVEHYETRCFCGYVAVYINVSQKDLAYIKIYFKSYDLPSLQNLKTSLAHAYS